MFLGLVDMLFGHVGRDFGRTCWPDMLVETSPGTFGNLSGIFEPIDSPFGSIDSPFGIGTPMTVFKKLAISNDILKCLNVLGLIETLVIS